MKEFKNKVVVVTGAGSGMGRSYAIEFAKLGARLALNDYDLKSLNETKKILATQKFTDVYTEAFDVSDKNKMNVFAKNVKEKFGNAHVIINNAGIDGSNKPIFLLETEDFNRVMQINFFGVVNGTLAFLPQLVENNEGAVVNISSIFGLVGTPNFGDYCASKFAVRGFTESLMVEFHESPISIHCIHPGGIDTNIVKNNKNGNNEFDKKYLSTSPESIVKYVIKAIQRGQAKVVFGNDSLKTWLGSNLIPQGILKGIIWSELKKVVNLNEYKSFIKKK